jgi:hypothetical protein
MDLGIRIWMLGYDLDFWGLEFWIYGTASRLRVEGLGYMISV